MKAVSWRWDHHSLIVNSAHTRASPERRLRAHSARCQTESGDNAGDYKCDGCPDAQPRPGEDKGFSCRPLSSVSLLRDNTLRSDDPAMGVVVGGGWRNRLTLPVIEGLGIPVMHTWNQSVPLWEYHHGFQVAPCCT